ncbi:hypothetical protein BHE74_00006263 [Ensete ventricosum]|nr:hypothetical protein BHE74_00006263 [Ensete ventricosum]
MGSCNPLFVPPEKAKTTGRLCYFGQPRSTDRGGRERSTEKGLHDLPTRIHRRHVSVESQPAGPTDVDRSKFGRATKRVDSHRPDAATEDITSVAAAGDDCLVNGTGHGAHALLASALASEGSKEPKHNERIIPIECLCGAAHDLVILVHGSPSRLGYRHPVLRDPTFHLPPLFLKNLALQCRAIGNGTQNSDEISRRRVACMERRLKHARMVFVGSQAAVDVCPIPAREQHVSWLLPADCPCNLALSDLSGPLDPRAHHGRTVPGNAIPCNSRAQHQAKDWEVKKEGE